MSPILIATLAGISTAFLWGTSDWLAAKSSKDLNPWEVNFAFGIVALVFSMLVFAFGHPAAPTLQQAGLLFVSSLFIMFAFLLMVKAFSSGHVGIVSPLANSYPLITILLALIFLGEVFSVRELGAMLAITSGIIILSYEKTSNKVPLREQHKETVLALFAAICFGLGFFTLEPIIGELSWQTLVAVSYLYSFLANLVVLWITSGSKVVKSMRNAFSHKLVWLGGLTGILGSLTLYLGSDAADSLVIPVVLSAAGPLVASLWGALYDKEVLGVLKRIGAVIIVAGIIVLNIS